MPRQKKPKTAAATKAAADKAAACRQAASPINASAALDTSEALTGSTAQRSMQLEEMVKVNRAAQAAQGADSGGGGGGDGASAQPKQTRNERDRKRRNAFGKPKQYVLLLSPTMSLVSLAVATQLGDTRAGQQALAPLVVVYFHSSHSSLDVHMLLLSLAPTSLVHVQA